MLSYDALSKNLFDAKSWPDYVADYVRISLDSELPENIIQRSSDFSKFKEELKSKNTNLVYLLYLDFEIYIENDYGFLEHFSEEIEYMRSVSRFLFKNKAEISFIVFVSNGNLNNYNTIYADGREILSGISKFDLQLEWSKEDLLRLIRLHQITYKDESYFQTINDYNLKSIYNEDESSLERLLYPFWGKKLSKDDGNAPYTADYVYAVFRTYIGNLKKFLKDFTSALQGIEQTDAFPDRLIPPEAIFKLGKMAKEQK